MESTKLKETSEALAAIVLVTMEVIKLGKDGFNVSDLKQAFDDLTAKEASAILFAGLQGDGKILEELKNLSLADKVEAVGQALILAASVVRGQIATA
jgi:hypothetical protein